MPEHRGYLSLRLPGDEIVFRFHEPMCRLLLLVLLLSTSSCRSTKPWLSWGEGGGFTGLQQGYTVWRDGTIEMWRQSPGDPPQTQTRGKLRRAQRQQIEAVYRQLQTLPAYNSPGNYSRFIHRYTSRDTAQWIWSPSDTHAVARTLQMLYEMLNQNVQQP